MTPSRKTLFAVLLCVLVTRVTGVHLHLCPHEEGPQSELHTFTHEDLGCAEPDGSGPEPVGAELNAGDDGLVKTLKLAFDLPALTSPAAAATADSPRDRVPVAAQTVSTDHRRALRPPLRGPPI